MSEHGESAPPSDSSRRSRAGSVVVLEDAEEDPSVVQSELLTYISVGFLPGRKVFLPHEGEKQGRKYFCHSFCHFCRGEMAEIIKT